MTPALPAVHIHVPTWVCVVALLILAAALAWDVLGTQVVRDQIEQAADDATQAKADAAHARADARAAIDHITDTGTGRHHVPDKPRPWPRATVRSEG